MVPQASNKKLLTAMGKVDGAAELLSSFNSSGLSEAVGTAACGAAPAGAPVLPSSGVPRGRRLGPPPPAAATCATPLPLAAPAGSAAVSDRAEDKEDDEMEEEGDES